MPPRQRARCPECRQDMTAVLVPFEGNELELDICRHCQRIWTEEIKRDQPARIDISDPGSARKPPVIPLTPRRTPSRIGEEISRNRALLRLNSRPINSTASWVILVILAVVGIIVRYYVLSSFRRH